MADISIEGDVDFPQIGINDNQTEQKTENQIYSEGDVDKIAERRELLSNIKNRLNKPHLGKILSSFSTLDFDNMSITELEANLQDMKFATSSFTNTTVIETVIPPAIQMIEQQVSKISNGRLKLDGMTSRCMQDENFLIILEEISCDMNTGDKYVPPIQRLGQTILKAAAFTHLQNTYMEKQNTPVKVEYKVEPKEVPVETYEKYKDLIKTEE